MCLINLSIMVPFCRRTEEARSLVEAMGKCGLKSVTGWRNGGMQPSVRHHLAAACSKNAESVEWGRFANLTSIKSLLESMI